MGNLQINVNGQINRPKVDDNSMKLDAQTITFDSSSFTKNWYDPQGGNPSLVTIKSVPTILNLEYNSADAAIGTSFDSVNSGLLSFNLDPKYAIHNSHLYEFSKDIDLIIADYDALGYKLIANVQGLLTFIKPANLSDIAFVQGEGKDLEDLQFKFVTQSSVSNLDSEENTFSILPWENVNLKTNYIIQSGGTGNNPVTGLDVTGTDTKTITITFADATTITADFIDNDTVSSVTVTDANINADRNNIAIVDGTNLYETVTALITPTFTNNVLTLKYKNENFVEQQVQVDLSSVLPTNDINIDTANYDAATNIITLTESNGDTYTIDLSEFSISTTTNPDGSVDIIQEGVTKITISKVGISNNYNDLDNLPNLDFDKYIDWKLKINGDVPTDITSQQIVEFLNGTNTTITRVGNQITFNSSYVNSYISGATWDSLTGDITITRTDGLADIVFNIDNRYLQDVIVNDTNTNLDTHKIGDVHGTDLKETVTKLNTPTLANNILTIKYVNENDIEQTVTVDISGVLPTNDINIDSANYNASTNIITLTETNGDTYNIDLSEFSIQTVTNPNGSVQINQEGVTKITISKVGISNNYNDLDNKPVVNDTNPNTPKHKIADAHDIDIHETVTSLTEPTRLYNIATLGLNKEDGTTQYVELDLNILPKGLKGQLYFIDENGTNVVIPEYLFKRGIVVQSQREFDVATTAGIQLQEVFETWDQFSHYESDLGGGVSPPTFPVFTPNDPQSTTRLTQEEFYDGLWQYDSTNDRIFLTKNVHPYTGFISPREFGTFTFEATMSSPNSDDDQLSLVIGFWVDPQTGYEHTLSVVRQLTPNSGQGDIVYSVWINYGQTNAEMIHDGSTTAPYPTGTPGGWNVNSPTRVQAIRTGNIYNIKCSQFGSEVIDDATLFTIDLDSDPKYEPFRVATKVGFGARSQVDARFSNIEFDGLTDFIFWQSPNGTYDTYEYNQTTELFELQDPKTIFARDYFNYCKFIYSYMFDKIYYIDEKDRLICVKGDEGVSWDANNALTLGSDNRPYLNNLLVGGNQNRILSFNPGYDSGLTYNTYATWKIDNNIYELSKTITLSAADATNDRIDVFVLNSDGDIIIKEGTPAVNPVKPEIDPNTELEASFVIIPANATAPEGIQVTTIYDENLGTAGGEVDGEPTPTGNTRIVMDSAVDPSTGTVSIEATNLLKYDAVEFTFATPIDINTVSQINYSLKNKPGIYYTIAKNGNGKNRTFEEVPIQTYRIMLQGDDSAGNFKSIYLEDDPNYSVYNDTTYQSLSAAINTSELVNIKWIRIICNADDSVNFGYFLDTIKFVGGINQNPTGDWATVEYVNNQDAVHLNLAKQYTDDSHDHKVTMINIPVGELTTIDVAGVREWLNNNPRTSNGQTTYLIEIIE